jgi:hypothetical protein
MDAHQYQQLLTRIAELEHQTFSLERQVLTLDRLNTNLTGRVIQLEQRVESLSRWGLNFPTPRRFVPPQNLSNSPLPTSPSISSLASRFPSYFIQILPSPLLSKAQVFLQLHQCNFRITLQHRNGHRELGGTCKTIPFPSILTIKFGDTLESSPTFSDFTIGSKFPQFSG